MVNIKIYPKPRPVKGLYCKRAWSKAEFQLTLKTEFPGVKSSLSLLDALLIPSCNI